MDGSEKDEGVDHIDLNYSGQFIDERRKQLVLKYLDKQYTLDST